MTPLDGHEDGLGGHEDLPQGWTERDVTYADFRKNANLRNAWSKHETAYFHDDKAPNGQVSRPVETSETQTGDGNGHIDEQQEQDSEDGTPSLGRCVDANDGTCQGKDGSKLDKDSCESQIDYSNASCYDDTQCLRREGWGSSCASLKSQYGCGTDEQLSLWQSLSDLLPWNRDAGENRRVVRQCCQKQCDLCSTTCMWKQPRGSVSGPWIDVSKILDELLGIEVPRELLLLVLLLVIATGLILWNNIMPPGYEQCMRLLFDDQECIVPHTPAGQSYTSPTHELNWTGQTRTFHEVYAYEKFIAMDINKLKSFGFNDVVATKVAQYICQIREADREELPSTKQTKWFVKNSCKNGWNINNCKITEMKIFSEKGSEKFCMAFKWCKAEAKRTADTNPNLQLHHDGLRQRRGRSTETSQQGALSGEQRTQNEENGCFKCFGKCLMWIFLIFVAICFLVVLQKYVWHPRY